MRSVLFAVLLFSLSSCHAQPIAGLQSNPDENTLLWEVSGNGLAVPSYIFGTFHLLCKQDINFSNTLKQAVGRADTVYMELDMDDPSVLLGGLTMMSMKEGKKLKDLYKPEEYDRVEAFFKDSLQTPLTLFQRMKPLLLTSLIYPKLMPCNTVSGIEEELLKLAKDDKKEIKGLETLAFQASIFDSIPYEKQAVEMLKTIDSLQKSKQYFDSMVVAYKSQDMKAIEKLMADDDFGMEDSQDILLDRRNRNWVQQLNTIMKKGSVFTAVGAGHLAGSNGLVSLLRKEGYTLRPLLNK